MQIVYLMMKIFVELSKLKIILSIQTKNKNSSLK